MDLLKQEIERKRKAIELAKQSNKVRKVVAATNEHTNNNNKDGDDGIHEKNEKVYLKTADMKRFQETEFIEKSKQNKTLLKNSTSSTTRHPDGDHDTIQSSNNESSNIDTNTSLQNNSQSSSKINPNDKTKTDINTTSTTTTTSPPATTNIQLPLSTEEITKSLREFGIPVWLFAEINDEQRYKRLLDAQEQQKAAMAGVSEMDEFRLGSGHGIRNPFLGGKKSKNATILDHDLVGGGGGGDVMNAAKKASSSSSNGNEEKRENDLEEHKKDDNDDEDDAHKTIYHFFKSVLRQWEEDIVNRPETVKRSMAGKNETKTLKQCKDYIRPLFKQCKSRRLDESMTAHLLKIVNFCKEGEFVKANDAYMDVAIGRAAWPIGVTMVGIHARSGRAKIESSNVAHVMNSELQRKYLTSVKRLMNYCQKKRTDVAPSKKVTNL